MSKESQIMGQLAAAIDTLEKMASFMADEDAFAPSGVWLSLSDGSVMMGYEPLRQAISQVVLDSWPQLRDEAIRRQGIEVERLRIELLEEQTRAAAARPEPKLL